jgi:hypothetical protein
LESGKWREEKEIGTTEQNWRGKEDRSRNEIKEEIRKLELNKSGEQSIGYVQSK